jgi:hypothetical protein
VPVGERVAAAVCPDGEYGDRNDQEGRDVGGGAARSKDLFVQLELSPVASYPEIPGPHTPGNPARFGGIAQIMFFVTLKRSLMLTAVLLVAALAGTVGTSSAAIKTGVYDLFTFSNATQRANSLDKTRAGGANLAKSLVYWRSVAPGSEPGNPQNPAAYNWAVPDAFVNAATSRGLEPVLTIFQAPSWASGERKSRNGYDGVNNVDSAKFHDFAVALATHYGGQVHYYEVWNEPNLPWFFTPQLKNDKFVSPAKYRALVNAFATGIHSVTPNAVVIAGNTAPFGHPPPTGQAIGPKPFLKGVASAPVHFDAWSTHPYTYGGPTHDANKDSDVSLGDMGELRRILNKARSSGRILGSHKPQLWASEFSWDSHGPDQRGVDMGLLSRWISETVYRLNRAGVNALLWFGMRDRPFGGIQTQSGFWFCGTGDLSDDGTGSGECGNSSFNSANDVKKPIFNAFRFPFVAYAGHGKVKVWGKRPGGVGGNVEIWRRKPSGNWSKVTTINPGANFGKTFNSSWTKGFYQARIPSAGIQSVPFSLTRVGDKAVLPFGCLSTPTCDKSGRPN